MMRYILEINVPYALSTTSVTVKYMEFYKE